MRGNQRCGRQNNNTIRRGNFRNQITIEIGVGHTEDRIEMERMAKVLVTVDQGQVQGQLQIEIGLDDLNVANTTLDDLNVANTTVLLGPVQLYR